jgi:hypothetical protein
MYAGYNHVTTVGGRERVACLAHARRKFFDAKDSAPEAEEALKIIRDVYLVEHEIKARHLEQTGASVASTASGAMSGANISVVSTQVKPSTSMMCGSSMLWFATRARGVWSVPRGQYSARETFRFASTSQMPAGVDRDGLTSNPMESPRFSLSPASMGALPHSPPRRTKTCTE